MPIAHNVKPDIKSNIWLTTVCSVFRYAMDVGEFNQADKRAGTVVSDPHFVLRALSITLSGEGNMGSVLGEIAVGG